MKQGILICTKFEKLQEYLDRNLPLLRADVALRIRLVQTARDQNFVPRV
jgi:hypothetical protein